MAKISGYVAEEMADGWADHGILHIKFPAENAQTRLPWQSEG